MKAVLAVAVLFIAIAPAMRADQMYDVTGTATITGNNTCNPAPCMETIDFSILFNEYYEGNGFDAYRLSVISDSATFSGPLSLTFGTAVVSAVPGPGSDEANYIPIHSPDNGLWPDEFDLWLTDNVEPSPFTPGVRGMGEFSCSTATCQQDFCTPDATQATLMNEGCTFAGQGYFMPISVTDSAEVVAAPEPSTLALLGFGLLALIVTGWQKNISIPRETR